MGLFGCGHLLVELTSDQLCGFVGFLFLLLGLFLLDYASGVELEHLVLVLEWVLLPGNTPSAWPLGSVDHTLDFVRIDDSRNVRVGHDRSREFIVRLE